MSRYRIKPKAKRKLTNLMTRAYGSYRVGTKNSKKGMWNRLTQRARIHDMKRKWKNPKAGLRRKRYYAK